MRTTPKENEQNVIKMYKDSTDYTGTEGKGRHTHTRALMRAHTTSKRTC